MKCSVKNLRVTLHNLVQSSCNQSQSQSVSQSVCQPVVWRTKMKFTRVLNWKHVSRVQRRSQQQQKQKQL